MSAEDAHDVPVTRALESQLLSFLDKASTVRTTDAIETLLPAAPFEKDIDALSQSLPSSDEISQSSRHTIFETAARDVFYSLVAKHTTDPHIFLSICNLLDLLQLCADHSLCEPGLSLYLIEELLDSQTIDGCRQVFDYLESRRERLITNAFTKNKQLVVLRSCNELLRRLSRAEDAVFCGRVFMFLFQSFPLGDKSAVNLRGEFHTENVTIFDQMVGKLEKEVADEQVDVMDVDTEIKEEKEDVIEEPKVVPASTPSAEQTTQKTSTPTTATPAEPTNDSTEPEKEPEMDMDTLYTSFWSLQRIFSDPRLAFNDTELSSFKTGLSATLHKFKSVTKVVQTRGTPRAPHDQRKDLKRKRSSHTSSHAHDEFATNFNPKYLTSRDLFTLELSDLTFQRHILVQSLITLDFLLSLSPSSLARLTKTTTIKPQKALLYPFTLAPDDEKWCTDMRKEIATYLQEGPEGKFYYRMVETVMARDRNWVRWKVESCPPISLPPLSPATYLAARAGAKRHCAPRRIRPNVMGQMNLDFLNDSGDNAAGLARLKGKVVVPDVQAQVSRARALELDLEMASKEEKPLMLAEKASNTWRVLRVMSKERLNVFDVLEENGNLDVLDEEKTAAKRAEEEEEAGKTAEVVKEETDGGGDGDGDAADVKVAEDVIMQEDEAVVKDEADQPTPIPASVDDTDAVLETPEHPAPPPPAATSSNSNDLDLDASDKTAASSLQHAAGHSDGGAIQAVNSHPVADPAQLEQTGVVQPVESADQTGAIGVEGDEEVVSTIQGVLEEDGGVALFVEEGGRVGGVAQAQAQAEDGEGEAGDAEMVG